MNVPEAEGVPTPMLRSLQIVVGALLMGVLVFAVVAPIARGNNAPQVQPDTPFLSYVAVGFAITIMLVRAVVIPILAKAHRKKLIGSPEITAKQLMEGYS